MRNLTWTELATRGPAAICFATTGTAYAPIAHAAGPYMNRAHSILVASRTQNILA